MPSTADPATPASGPSQADSRATTRRVFAQDGTAIAWHAYPAGPRAASRPPVVLTNGLGSTANFWTTLVDALAPDHRVVHWDYRGHADSDVSRTRDYSMTTQADDLRRVTEAVALDAPEHGRAPAAVHVAYSMGVTVLLELYRRRPDLVRAMVLVAGGADFPYATSRLLKVPGVHAAIRLGLGLAAPVVPAFRPLTRRLSKSKAIFPLGQTLGALGAAAPRVEVEHFFRAVGEMDPRAYWATLRALLRAHASDVLPSVSVPVLIVAPDNDIMAPRGDLELLQDTIPRASWYQVPRTGHAILLEAGDAVAGAVRGFLRGVT
jgi:pimeloyl-ACP methyl ester carboxylesterase